MKETPDPREGLQRLIEHFEQNLYALKSTQYNETQARLEFINPFFTLLGWDMDNRQGYAEAYKDVIHEDAIKVGGYTKAPDYCFRIGGTRKFFVEAKKPSVNLKDDPEPAYQLRRYAWSAKLPLSILTDFQELAIYDCRVKPSPGDKASVGRVRYLNYRDYAKEWESLASIFSREAVLKGSFDKYAESEKAKRGTTEVDKAFLQEIEAWRDALARNLALRNPNLTTRELNFAVQTTIDRLIFLRICEDRGVEDYARLMALQNGPDVYPRLMGLFRAADERYNSGLFHFESEKGREAHDTLTPSLTVDDKVLKEILKGLYYPDSPYEFSVLPADILGQVYEQFLGKVIRLTAGHQAKVEDKPEVKRAGGVYYTPTYIVDYIVKNTVGKMLEGKTPAQASGESRRGGAPSPPVVGLARPTGGHGGPPLRILDPACGSGSFLLGAYQYLLTWYRDRYIEEGAEKWAKGKEPRLYQASGGEWKLTTSERKRILLNHIYGVDIDAQAVEVTKLSLLLKVLEGETKESVSYQRRLFHERALPDLSRNIKCGNSLIGSDFYKGEQSGLFADDEERERINAFDWEVEFPEVFRGREKPVGRDKAKAFTTENTESTEKGFDVVIGNPPYVMLQDEMRDDEQMSYFRRKFPCSSFKVDTYHLFMELGIRLIREGGRFSMITPSNYLSNNYLSELRKFMVTKSTIDHIMVLEDGVFSGVSVDNAVVVLVGGAKRSDSEFGVLYVSGKDGRLIPNQESKVDCKRVLADPNHLFLSAASVGAETVLSKLERESIHLRSVATVSFGKQLRDRAKYPQDVVQQTGKALPIPYKKCLTGKDISRYSLSWSGLWCLDDREAKRGGCWDDRIHNMKGKLITRQIGRVPSFAYDERGYQCLNTVFMVAPLADCPSGLYLLGLLNSALLQWVWLAKYYDRRRTFPKIKGTYLLQMPIRSIDPNDHSEVVRHDMIATNVKRILDLDERLGQAKTDHDKTLLQRQIAATDKEIDRLVYDLYGLTDDEITIVKESKRP